ncbi:MAG: DUF3450 domain-containing protein [Candidatus Obscuribacterales bacterium]|nr:DUF3450 domain-containing protein [Candidatus Obscuribacterales bacterium]
MQIKSIPTLVALSLAAIVLLSVPANKAADDSQNPAKKKCMSDVLKQCCDRQAQTSDTLSKLIAQLSSASKSDDPAKMKSAIEDAKKSLANLKADHEKSRASLKKIHERMESLKKQIKKSKIEHDKASGIVEDEDMDDIIWAY